MPVRCTTVCYYYYWSRRIEVVVVVVVVAAAVGHGHVLMKVTARDRGLGLFHVSVRVFPMGHDHLIRETQTILLLNNIQNGIK